jgi:phosphate starvation-inducible PhoH-like protein
MNLYRLLIIFYLFKNLWSFNIQTDNKKITNLYMKKQTSKYLNKYSPKTEKQKSYVNYLDDNEVKIILSLGPAGTGKTLFACQKSIIQLKSEKIDKIIITRPLVTVEEEIGFLPGNIIQKMEPWTKPIFDIFLEYLSKTELDLMLKNNKIEICPLGFMRGRTFKNAYIIADEMQNSSPNQMKMLTTRLGENSRLIITGDLEQTDIKSKNGLIDLLIKLKKYKVSNNYSKLINIIEFENSDIERSDIVKQVIDIYDYKNDMVFDTTVFDNNKVNIKNVNIINKIVQNQEVSQVEVCQEVCQEVSQVEVCQEVCQEVTQKEVSKVETVPKVEVEVCKEANSELDAALIPKHHYSHNYDIYFEKKDFY